MKFSFIDKKRGSIKDDILAGITTSLAIVPETVAFAFVAGVSPIVGLYGSFMMGIILALLGGRPGMISGAAGAMAVVSVHLIAKGNAIADGTGVHYLFFALLLTGIIQFLFGAFKLGKFIRLIPASVMMGFVNGLSIVICIAQIKMFKVNGEWMVGNELYLMIGLVALTMLLMYIVPKISKAIPSALIAMLVVTLAVIFVGLDTPTVKSFIVDRGGVGISAGLPKFEIPQVPFTLDTLWLVLPYSLTLAAVGLVESLMTMNLVDELTETRGSGNREASAQGVANFINGLFGGMGGCAMIGQSMINIKSGGRGRLSGVTTALALLVFILFASTYIEMIPIAALIGVMFMVVIGTFAWNTFRIVNKVPKADVAVVLFVTILTIIFDLAVAVFAGIVIASLVFAWENAIRIRARKSIDEHGIKHYEIYGPLFFGSTTLFLEKFEIEDDPNEVVVDFKESRIADQSAIEAINKLAERYQKAGKRIHLRHLSLDCIKLIKKAEKICDVNVVEDPNYFVAIDDYNKAKLNN